MNTPFNFSASTFQFPSTSLSTQFAPSSAPTLTIPPTTSAAVSTVHHGLGGPVNESSGNDTNSSKSAKESSNLPPEMLPMVEALKKFVKEQKLIREENSQQRFSIQPILEVEAELENNLKVNLHKIDLELQRNAKSIEAIKKETNKLLANAEMGLRISRIDTPTMATTYSMAQNQFISSCMHQYFIETIEHFEAGMKKYENQIKDLELHLNNMNKSHTADELFQILRKQHETLISLAAQVYAIHEQISKMKQTKQVSTVPSTTSSSASASKPQDYLGPNPFSSTTITSSLAFVPTTSFGQPTFSGIPQKTAAPFQLTSTSPPRAKRWTTS